MKNLLIILSLSFVFACHTKEEQKNSGINDPINIIKGDVDQSVLSASTANIPAPAPKAAPDSAASCVDSSKIQPDVMCTQEFKPVCGCDGKEYSNQCEAEKAGLTKWTDGPCEKKEEEKKKPATKSKTDSKKDSKKDKKKKKK